MVSRKRAFTIVQWLPAAAATTALLLIATWPWAASPPWSWTPALVVHACGHISMNLGGGQLLTTAGVLVAALATVRAARAGATLQAATRRATTLPGAPMRVGETPITVLPGAAVFAFTAGWLRPRIYVSAGATDALSPAELAAVVAHERHHQHRRDPLRLAARAIAAEALFFLPGMRRLQRRLADLAELEADAAATHAAGGDRQPLAGALLAFDTAAPAGVGVDRARVDHLLGGDAGPAVRWTHLGLPALVAAIVVLLSLAAVHRQSASHEQLRVCATAIALAVTAIALPCVLWRAAPSTRWTRPPHGT
jgi:hypothetical protein